MKVSTPERDDFNREARRANKARKSDGVTCVTCPASRHAHMIADYVGRREPYPMLQEEPEHCAGSIMSAVGSLYLARRELEESRQQAQRLYDALKRITAYQSPDKIHRSAGRATGLDSDEEIEYAYENVLGEAAAAIKGMKRPFTGAESLRAALEELDQLK